MAQDYAKLTAAITPISYRLPRNWAAFVDAVALGQDPTTAADALGYANARETGLALIRHPQVRKALAAASLARLEGVSLPLALDTVDEILRDQSAPKAVRAKLALGIVDRLIKKEGGDASAGASGKNLADMTVRELEQLIAQSGALPGEMRDVTPEAIRTDEQ